MKRTKLLMMVAMALVICLPGMALVTIVNFDDLPTPYTATDGSVWGPVPSDYQGWTWGGGWGVQNNDNFKSNYNNTGDFPSLPNAAYNGNGSDVMTINFNSTINLVSAYFRSWSQDDAFQSWSATLVTLKGYLGATELYTLDVNLSATGMVLTPINFIGVDNVTFTKGSSDDQWWLMDHVNAVPLSPSVLLLGSGILGLVGLGWRRARKES